MRGKSDSMGARGDKSLKSLQKLTSQQAYSNSFFFDDPEPSKKNQSSLWIKNRFLKIENWTIQTKLKKKKNESDTCIENIYCLSGDKIFKLDDKCRVVKYMEVSNLTLERLNPQNEQVMFGFKIQRGSQAVELFSPSLREREDWFNLLKLYAIQTQFHNEYTTSRIIGQGNFSKVYECINKDTNQKRAVKAFERGKFCDLKMERVFVFCQTELDMMRRMNHPVIIKLHEVFENDEHIFLVCDYLEGGELFQILNKKVSVYDEYNAAIIIQKLLQALEYIHSQGIIHRDIKPENIIFRSKTDLTDVCIVDFGLADNYNPEGNYQFKRCGTPGYVAPEILKDQNYDFKVDMFSVGVLMFIMLTGSSPFQAPSYKQLVLQNYKCLVQYSAIINLSQDAQVLLRSLLSEDPRYRPDANQALQNRWFDSVNQQHYQNIIHQHGLYSYYDESQQIRPPLIKMSQASTNISSQAYDASFVIPQWTSQYQQQMQQIQFIQFQQLKQLKQQQQVITLSKFAQQQQHEVIQIDDDESYQIEEELSESSPHMKVWLGQISPKN